MASKEEKFTTLTKSMTWGKLEPSSFRGATLERFVVDQLNQTWIIYMKLPRVLPVAVLKEFINNLSIYYRKTAKLDIFFTYDQGLDKFEDREEGSKIIIDYWHEVIQASLGDKFPFSRGFFLACDCNHDYQFSLTIIDDIAYESVKNKNIDSEIEKLFEKYLGLAIKLTIDFPCQDTSCHLEDYLAEKERLEADYIKTAMAQVEIMDKKTKSKAPDKTVTISGGYQVLYGRNIENIESQPIDSVSEHSTSVTISGRAFAYDIRQLKQGSYLVSFNITDDTNSIKVKAFTRKEEQVAQLNAIKKHPYIKVRGKVEFDTFDKQYVLMASDIMMTPAQIRMDNAEDKRIELHLHTSMSSMDGIRSARDLVERAALWGHEAIAITDHGVVQAFPEAYQTGSKHKIKIIYGLEAYMVDDGAPIVFNSREMDLDDQVSYIVFDTETTGLSAVENSLTEIACVKVINNQIVDSYQSLIKPRHYISDKITELTGISNEMVANAPSLEEVMGEFMDFIQGSVLVAHNANFDLGFINTSLALVARDPISQPVIDTVSLARFTNPGLKSYKLNELASLYEINLDNHHRALDDSKATAELFIKLLAEARDKGINKLEELNEQTLDRNVGRMDSWHTIILAQNQKGLKNLYKLVSKAHIDYFYKFPRIPKSELVKHREGLIIGSACEAGELFQAILFNKPQNVIEEIADFYDYLEVQPIMNNYFMVKRSIVDGVEGIQNINKKIYKLGQELGKKVVATGDVHFLDPGDAKFREILMASQNYPDAQDQAPLYLKTTDEMLADFDYFGPDIARELVIDNPRAINNMIDEIQPYPSKLYTPAIAGANDEVRSLTIERAKLIYGEDLPDLVRERLEFELDSIIGNGFAVVYLISQKIVKKSLDDGYLVGSRGSVGSSLVATMMNITEVNPLPPHYVCPSCQYSEFITDNSIGSGYDLVDKDCPKCQHKLKKDGHDIPFETFMGFKGDKVPDIDLNFSGEYQGHAHSYVEELFGKDYVFRAGTINTLANKSAYSMVMKYQEENSLLFRQAEIDRLTAGCSGIKRTTGQHPGGQIVVPDDMEIYDFTPIQYPADKNARHYTTHFDYNAIADCLLKLDILGHDDPTAIRMLEDMTGIAPQDIPMDDPATMSIFSSTEIMVSGYSDLMSSPVATFAIPEFGTEFVRQMLVDTKPTTFSELVRISGLSHGTDVWLNNARDVIKNKQAVLSEVISTRDDIMIYLIHKGLEPSWAFSIMESVRKGRGLKEDDEAEMRSKGVPEWYIDSCKKIKYMFPKAHAVAYVMMAVRIAYFKIHHPLEFYASYFTLKANDFNYEIIMAGPEKIKAKLQELASKGNAQSQTDKNLNNILNVAYEMLGRGYKFYSIRLDKSDASKFTLAEDGLIPPFVSLEGVGLGQAQSLYNACNGSAILSIEDFQQKSKATQKVMEILRDNKCFLDLPERNQLSLF